MKTLLWLAILLEVGLVLAWKWPENHFCHRFYRDTYSGEETINLQAMALTFTMPRRLLLVEQGLLYISEPLNRSFINFSALTFSGPSEGDWIEYFIRHGNLLPPEALPKLASLNRTTTRWMHSVIFEGGKGVTVLQSLDLEELHVVATDFLDINATGLEYYVVNSNLHRQKMELMDHRVVSPFIFFRNVSTDHHVFIAVTSTSLVSSRDDYVNALRSGTLFDKVRAGENYAWLELDELDHIEFKKPPAKPGHPLFYSVPFGFDIDPYVWLVDQMKDRVYVMERETRDEDEFDHVQVVKTIPFVDFFGCGTNDGGRTSSDSNKDSLNTLIIITVVLVAFLVGLLAGVALMHVAQREKTQKSRSSSPKPNSPKPNTTTVTTVDIRPEIQVTQALGQYLKARRKPRPRTTGSTISTRSKHKNKKRKSKTVEWNV